MACIGIDIGGTFTDAVLTEGATLWRAKSPTVPGDVVASVVGAVRAVAQKAGSTVEALLPSVDRFGVGTTAVTNTLASRTGLTVGLVTTAGFEDSVPLAKGRRVAEGAWSSSPEPIVERSRIRGVVERIDRDGRVVVPLDPSDAVAAARDLVAAGAEALALSFLWSFRNPVHEQQAADAIRTALPDVPLMVGSELQPTIREFERTTHAVLNAYTAAAFTSIDGLEAELARLGLAVRPLLVHSGGGTITSAEARRTPLGLAVSGPAAGVAASTAVAGAAGVGDAVTCDMGGTSFDVAVVSGGHVPRRTRSELFGVWTSLPMVDVESIGAGGGSIAWVDARGMLRVGPRSAGAVPGPACYGRGGTDATVTDALLVLGYLDPSTFLGGEMVLDVDAARAACARLGEPLGLDAVETAWGIRRIALEGMTKAVRSLLTARGLDPRSQSLVSYGGCGALFTPDIAGALGAARVVVPELSSVLSAFGAATADIRRDRARSLGAYLPGDPDALEKVASELRDLVLDDLAADGVPTAERRVVFEADLRFARQVWELTVPLEVERFDAAAVDALLAAFRAEYTRRYGAGSMMLGAPVELVTLRAVGVGGTVKPPVTSGRRAPVRKGTPATPVGSRRVRVERGRRGWIDVAVYAGHALRPGHTLNGPAVVDEQDTTVWVPPGAAVHVDRTGALLLAVARPSAGAGAAGSKTRARARRDDEDPIGLEILRSQLEAIAEDAASAIERTAISPVVTESKDYSATLLDAKGDLIVGGGVITYHWVAATRAIRATLERYGDEIEPGDVFLANDPYNGGGLHPNDVFVQRPIFSGRTLVAWVALSAHLIDMGGMAMGSFAPAATDCYQEALRIPPVRLLRRGVEVSDVWDIFRTNVRIAVLVEMDMRGLVAGGNVAHDKVAALADAMGHDAFALGVRRLQDLSERELRRRIERIADGTYRSTSWVEWDEELYKIPCELTVAGDTLRFDFTGAADQAPHFFNSKPYIIKSGLMMQAAWILAPDLPYSEGLLAPIVLDCPEGSVLNSLPPAPINAGHIHVAFTAAEVMSQCLRLALWATPDAPGDCPVAGWGSFSALALTTWSGIGLAGTPDTWMLMDGAWSGSSAGDDRDGGDMGSRSVGPPGPPTFPDVEILESWYPMLISQRRVRTGAGGAGRHRAGAGNHVRFRPHGTDRMVGQMLAMRSYVPLEGAAGGFPGAAVEMRVHRADGTVERVSTAAAGVVVQAGDEFEIACASGGGVGDPVDRSPEAVAEDVADGRITADEGKDVYGVVLRADGTVDGRATARARASLLKARLRRARPPVVRAAAAAAEGGVGLYPGIVERDGVAVVEASGTVLAAAPAHWTDGCAVLERVRPGGGPAIVERAYLDPATGRALHVEVVPQGEGRGFDVLPARWMGVGG